MTVAVFRYSANTGANSAYRDSLRVPRRQKTTARRAAHMSHWKSWAHDG